MLYDLILSKTAKALDRDDTLRELAILDSSPEPEFDAITEAAASILGCSISLVSLIDTDRQWFKARHNVSISETPIEWSFCRHAVERDETLVVEDATKDSRFIDNPLVTGDPMIRFYAGVPLALKRNCEGESVAFGTLCVIDEHPRSPTPEALAALTRLARLTEVLLAARLDTNKIQRQASALEVTNADKTRLHRQLHQAERMAGFGSWRLTLDDNHVEWSPQVYAIHEIPMVDPMPVATALDFYPGDGRARISTAIGNCIQNNEPYDLELDFVTASKIPRRVRAIGELEMKDGRPEALIGVIQDITERSNMEHKLRTAADTDDLTQLASRRRFNQQLDETIQSSLRNGSEVALVLIDLDHFKAVNDSLGHAVGDDVLREAALRMRAPWLQQSFAARPGGDEFVLILTDAHLLEQLDETLSRLLQDLQFSCAHGLGEDDLHLISATLGVAMLDHNRPNRVELLKSADDALYNAKDHGRGSAFMGNQRIDQPLTARYRVPG